MMLDVETLQAIRECCRDEEAFGRLQQILANLLIQQNSAREENLCQQRYEAILKAVPDRVFLVNRQGDNLDFKGTEEDSDHGIERETIIGTNLQQFVPTEVAQQCLDVISKTLDTGSLQTFEYQIPKAWEPNTGELHDYEVRLVMSGVEEVLAIERDITERRQVQVRTAQLQQKMQELQELSQRQEDFLHAISHDLRTPVMGMLLVLKNLQKKVEQSVTLSPTVLERMIQSCDHQLRMINLLLETHATEVQGVKLRYERVDLGELVRSIAEDMGPLLTENQATLTNLVPHNLPLTAADPAQIRRVFENLLTNAVNHNPPKLQIILQATIQAGWLRFTVEDNGNGMTQSESESLFERYARGSHAHRSAGIGLGLYLCRQIITAHGGQIGAFSESGAGAMFWFTLPLM